MLIDLQVDRREPTSRLYADLFFVSGRVYKVYKRHLWPYYDERAQNVFHAQTHAYERCQGDDLMRRHTPEYFGTYVIDAMFDEDGNDIGAGYRLDCCYSVELLDGDEEKVNSRIVLDECPWVWEVRSYFVSRGINTHDSSVFRFAEPETFKLIDFDAQGWGI